MGCFRNNILNKIWFTKKKKQYQSYVFLLFQMIFFIIYHPNASAVNEIQAVFHFGLFNIRFSSAHWTIRSYDSACSRIFPLNFVVLVVQNDHLCIFVEDDPCLFSKITWKPEPLLSCCWGFLDYCLHFHLQCFLLQNRQCPLYFPKFIQVFQSHVMFSVSLHKVS